MDKGISTWAVGNVCFEYRNIISSFSILHYSRELYKENLLWHLFQLCSFYSPEKVYSVVTLPVSLPHSYEKLTNIYIFHFSSLARWKTILQVLDIFSYPQCHLLNTNTAFRRKKSYLRLQFAKRILKLKFTCETVTKQDIHAKRKIKWRKQKHLDSPHALTAAPRLLSQH